MQISRELGRCRFKLKMCGIIAYKGKGKVSGILLEGLRNLEYRGYDSWGVAVLSGGKIESAKKVGKVSDAAGLPVPEGTTGIGHTRWATHGKVNEANAHPHSDCSGRIAAAHNGIIENHEALRKKLEGHGFRSETDSEIIPHLIEESLGKGKSFEDAVRSAAGQLKGRSAFVAVDARSGRIAAARKGTPLIVGMGKDGIFVASDINALLEHTRKIKYLNDDEFVSIGSGAEFYGIETGRGVEKRLVEVDWQPKAAGKEGYRHFLLKEIMEQKKTIWDAINQDESKIISVAEEIKKARGTFLIGCGTAGKVCMAGEYLFSKVAKKHVNAYVASEFPEYQSYLTPKSLIIAVSQSGETADVLEAVEAARKKRSKVVSLLNVFGSTLMRASDDYFMVNAGPEKAVVSTKATTAQLAVMTLLAYAVAGKLQEGKLILMDAARSVNDMLNPRYEDRIKKLARSLEKANDLYIIGRSLNYPVALESAIKLQETAYVHAQGFAGGELKHGHIALIEKGTPCIALTANDEVKDEIIANAMEIKSRGGYIIGVGPENDKVFDFWIRVPDAGNASPIVNVIPVQMLAYHIALLRGHDPDRPRNLAKSLTVK